MQPSTKSTKKVYCLLILAAVLWGGNAIAVKSILGEISPSMLILVRFIGISSILITVIFCREGKRGWRFPENIFSH